MITLYSIKCPECDRPSGKFENEIARVRHKEDMLCQYCSSNILKPYQTEFNVDQFMSIQYWRKIKYMRMSGRLSQKDEE